MILEPCAHRLVEKMAAENGYFHVIQLVLWAMPKCHGAPEVGS